MRLATYNILHGYHQNLILKNIKLLIEKGVDIICLQETDAPFETPLNNLLSSLRPSNWKVKYSHCGIAGNLAIVWNSSHVEMQNMETILLPTIAPVFIQKLKGHTIRLQRTVLTGTFLVKGETIRISNAHLAWEGGVAHRLNQVTYLKDALKKTSVDKDIIAGDFNTFAPSILRRDQQQKVEKILSEYTNTLPELKWSCDISYTAPQDGWDFIAKLCRYIGLKIQSRLDYIFVKNLQIISSEMLDLPGSDHRPIVVKFEIT